MSVKCMIIDDEPSSQNVLKQFINKVDFLSLESVCNNALEALDFLKENAVNLLFLDINMPHLSGLSFYKSLQNPPLVIFTTAYSEYALDGFDVNATDYLLKPFSFERFLKAVTKANKLLTSNKHKDNFVLIKVNKQLHKINFDEILAIEACGDYVKIYLEKKSLLTYSTFANLLHSLPTKIFVQVHKSHAVNKNKINFIEGNLVTINRLKIPIGKHFKTNFLSNI